MHYPKELCLLLPLPLYGEVVESSESGFVLPWQQFYKSRRGLCIIDA